MQNTWRRGLALGNAPDARIRRWGYQHVGIWSQRKPSNLRFYPTQNPNVSQWNRLRWVPKQNSGVAMYISCIFHVCFMLFCASFSAFATLELADAKADSSGIQALRIDRGSLGGALH